MPLDGVGQGGEADEVEEERLGRILSTLDESDLELLDPPASVWDGIDAAVAKAAPGLETPPGMVVEYWIDADDIVTRVGAGWADFARDNFAPELTSLAADRTLWSYVSHAEVRELWQLLVRRVRALQVAATVPLRCDGPDVRRWFEVTASPSPDGEVQFRSVLLFEEARAEVVLLDPTTERDAQAAPVALCSWCGRGEHDGRWHDIEALVTAARLLERDTMPPLSHGICAACREAMSAEVLLPGATGEPPSSGARPGR